VPSLLLPPPTYRPPVLSGLTYTGLPRAFSSLPTSLPPARGPFPVFTPALRIAPPLVPRLPMSPAYQQVVSGGGFWSGLAKVTAGAAIAAGLAFGAPEAAAGSIAYAAGTAAAGYVAKNVWHNMNHPAPGPAFPFPKYDLHGRLEPPPPPPLRPR
jgi:hypothetical protein